MHPTRRASMLATLGFLVACSGGDDEAEPERRLYGHSFDDIVGAATSLELDSGAFLMNGSVTESRWTDAGTGRDQVAWLAAPMIKWVSAGSPREWPVVRKGWFVHGDRFISSSDVRRENDQDVLVFKDPDLAFGKVPAFTVEVRIDGRTVLFGAVATLWLSIPEGRR